jgi:GNAT superfamily N-acetyltransferase
MASTAAPRVRGWPMPVDRVDPADTGALERFVTLERELWGHSPLYWSELDADLTRRLRGRSAFNRGMQHALFVLGDDASVPVGRAVGYVNRRWQHQRDWEAGFIGNFCFAPGARPGEVAELLGAVETWLAQQGCTDAICGIDGTGALGMGVLVEGNEASPMYPVKWHPPEYANLIEAAGYETVRRYWVYRTDFDDAQYRSASARALRDAACAVRPVSRRRWRSDLELVRTLFNETFANEWEMNQYSRDEFTEVWGAMKWFLDPRAFLVGEVDGEPAGFCLGLPDMTPLIRSCRGRLGPLDLLRIVRGVRKAERYGLFVAAVREPFRGQGVAQTLAARILHHYEQLGMTSALLYWVDDRNVASRRLCEGLGATGRIELHCYAKPLEQSATPGRNRPSTEVASAPPAGIEPATHGLGNRRSFH